MPSRRSRTQSALVESTQTRRDLRIHIEKLGLQSEAEYRRWCKGHGFGGGLFKSGDQKRKELDLANQERVRALLSRRRDHTRRPGKTFEQLFDKSVPDDSLGSASLGADYLDAVSTQFKHLEADPPARRAFLELLLAVEERGKFFGLEPALPHLGAHATNRFIDGLAQLARQHQGYVRPATAWTPESRNPRRQFGHLTRHLLARFPDVPAFMDAAWFGAADPGLERDQSLFLHLAAGGNIRTAPALPVHLTKAMAHAFLHAPDNLSISHALRWAQVTGQDGSETLARAVLATRLGESFDAEDFWSTVIVFFVRNPMLDPAQVGPIVDYVYHQKFEPEEQDLPGGGLALGDPPQPSFAMKSRSVDKLLRLVEQWHETLNQRAVDPFANGQQRSGSKRWQNLQKWERSEIGELDHEEVSTSSGESTRWQIRELCSNRILAAEGRMMHHCVSSYVKSCRGGSTSIWSVSARVDDKRIPVLTLAVDPRSRTVTQARGQVQRQPRPRRGAPWQEGQPRCRQRPYDSTRPSHDRALGAPGAVAAVLLSSVRDPDAHRSR